MADCNDWKLKLEPCTYSDRLLSKIMLLNEKAINMVDIQEVKKAIYYAKKYHGKQLRQSGEPYYSHPIEVAYMVSDYLFRTDIIVTSILHDTIEDTKLTKKMIESIFGELVATQVESLTRIKDDGRKISSTEMVESLWLQQKYDVLLIKQFDRLHNMQTIGAKSPEKIKKIIEETLNTFLLLAASFGAKNIEEELVKICTNIIRTDLLQELDYCSIGDDPKLPALTPQNDVIQKQILYLLEVK